MDRRQKYYQANKDRIAARDKAKREAETAEEREVRLARHRRRYQLNKVAHHAQMAEYRRTHDRGVYAESERAGHYRRKYGVTIERYEQMLAEQQGCCAACGSDSPGGRSKRFHIDHDHKTGAVRGLLCFHCNTALGKCGDSVERLMELAAYLIQSQNILERV